MIYFDTSFIAPLILSEATSNPIDNFMQSIVNQKLAVSHWTRVEFASLLSRRRRMNELDEMQAVQATNQFERLIDNYLVLVPTIDDFNLATHLLQHPSGLRSGDALHLAIATNNKVEIIYTLDRGLVNAATTLGIPISTGINL